MTFLRGAQVLIFFAKLAFQLLRKGEQAAPWTRKELAKLGATFVKLGQILSVRQDLVSQKWIDELSHLQDDLPPVPFEQIKQTIESELKKPIDKIFDYIEPLPIAVASIAQVHKAGYTLMGTKLEVAVKVQPPGVTEQFRTDIRILRRLKVLLYLIPGLMGGHSTDILDELELTFNQELDFFAEAQNMAAFRSLFSGDDSIVIAKVDWGRTRTRVLTAEYVPSIKISELPAIYPGRCEAASKLVLKAYVKQILEAGIFHADPHPGNLGVIVEKNRTRLVFYDFGMCGRLPEETKQDLFKLAEAVIFKDLDSVVNLVVKLGLLDRDALHNSEIREVIERFVKGEIDQNPTELIFRVREQLLEVSEKAELRYPRYLSMLGRTVFTMEGTCQLLRPGMNLIEEVAPYASSLYVKGTADRLQLDTARMITTAKNIWGQIEGPLQVNDNHNIASLRKLRFAVRSLSSSIITGCLLITAGLVLQKSLLGFAIIILIAHVHLYRHIQSDKKID